LAMVFVRWNSVGDLIKNPELFGPQTGNGVIVPIDRDEVDDDFLRGDMEGEETGGVMGRLGYG
jgi:hypothetical protein